MSDWILNTPQLYVHELHYEHFTLRNITQLTFTCPKSTTETLKKGVKYVQS